ncbi:radical SAM protein [Elusimicrobiota bacterium]
MYEGMVIRPPSEANSLILQVTLGCSHDKCTFCGTYDGKKFRMKPLEEVLSDIEAAAPDARAYTRRVFLADGDALVLSTGYLVKILDKLAVEMPDLQRVGIYANARDILRKKPEELELLRSKKLGIVYLGLESGDDEILKRVRKGATSAQMIEAVQKAQAAGMRASVIALLGLGGRGEGSRRHAVATGKVAGAMNPRYFSCLTLMLLDNTPLGKAYQAGEFELITPEESLRELRLMVEHMDVKNTIFRSNHASNYLPIGGSLPKDKKKILDAIDSCLSGETGMRPEFLRGL